MVGKFQLTGEKELGPPALSSPSKGVSSHSHLLVPLFCSGIGTVTETCCQEGVFSVFLFSTFISIGASSPHRVLLILLKGKHFLRGTDLSHPSKVTAGICDYLMGLADYEKAVCCGVPEKGKWAGGCLDLIKLCMKSWWPFQQSRKHRIRWEAAGQDWNIKPASREVSGLFYHLQRINS